MEADLVGGMLEPRQFPEGGAADLAICIALHIVEDGVIGHRPFHNFSLLYPISPLRATKKLTEPFYIAHAVICQCNDFWQCYDTGSGRRRNKDGLTPTITRRMRDWTPHVPAYAA